MHMKILTVFCAFIAIVAAMPAAAKASDRCSIREHTIVVTGGSEDDRALICAGAQQALDLLARCAITAHGAIYIRIQSEVRHPLAGLIFGYYDIKERHVVLTDLASLPALMEDTPYSGLPPVDFYKSLVVHEVVHSVMHQNLGERTQSQAAYEYPAYALQIASLPAQARAQFMKVFDEEHIARDVPFSDTILAFAPYFFAARAYTHFTASPEGCASIRSAMSGESLDGTRRVGLGTD